MADALERMRAVHHEELPDAPFDVAEIPGRVRRQRRRRGLAAGVAGLAAAALAVAAGSGLVGDRAAEPPAGSGPTSLRPVVPLAGCLDEPRTCAAVMDRTDTVGYSMAPAQATESNGVTVLTQRVEKPGSARGKYLALRIADPTPLLEAGDGDEIRLVDGTTARGGGEPVNDIDRREWVLDEVEGVRPRVTLTATGFGDQSPTAAEVAFLLDALVGDGEQAPGRGCTLVPSSCDEAAIRAWAQDRGYPMGSSEQFRRFDYGDIGEGDYMAPAGMQIMASGDRGTSPTHGRVAIIVGDLAWFDRTLGVLVDPREVTVDGVVVGVKRSVGDIYSEKTVTEQWRVRPGDGHAGVRVILKSPMDGEVTWTDADVKELLRLLLVD